jgi:Predicted permease.
MYFSEAFQNILENKKNIMVILVFLIISFTGIATTDSLIYSTSKKAESELSLNGSNIITVNFNEKISSKRINVLFKNNDYSLSRTKKVVYRSGTSPYSDELKVVMGIDKTKLSIRKININTPFEGNVILLSDSQVLNSPKPFFLNGIQFQPVGIIEKKKTEFLDSLGLSTFGENIGYIIPLETMFRLTLDDTIDSIDFVKDKEIGQNDIEHIKNKLLNNNINNFTIYSALDAKMAVERVLDRFSLLTNSIYTLLTVMMLIIITMVCRKTFQSRSTEFALKVIHGIDKAVITRTVIVELMIITFLGLLASVALTIILTYTLSSFLGLVLLFRPVMISFSFVLVIIASYASGLQVGTYFFRQNPVDIIKKRTL